MFEVDLMSDINILSELEENKKAVIRNINIKGTMRRRLQDLGLISGAEVECVLKKHNGMISAYNIKGALIALRKSDTDYIETITVEKEY